MTVPPLLILAIGIITVVGMILVFRINAFIALITAAMVVSLLAPGELANKFGRVAEAFGNSAGKIGIVIALAAVIGKCMMDSGAADRVVRSFLRLFGEQKASFALMGSGFVLSVPVFFDTVFYLLVPLARSLYRRTQKNYLMYIVAIGAGGAITHTLVPPTPGPLTMAANLDFDVGVMILVGTLVALPAAFVGVIFATVANRLMQTPMRQIGNEPDPEPLDDSELPPLSISLLPVILPVVLISTKTVTQALAKGAEVNSGLWQAAQLTGLLGDANWALLLSAAVALVTLRVQRGLNFSQLAQTVETSLMSGGVIILITAGGGAFGAMLEAAQIGPAIKALFEAETENQSAGLTMLFLGFGIASLMKIAQGSGTVAMITASSMLGAMISSPESLGFHPVYLATAIGAGSMCGSWMNDSGFWIFTKMGGLTEIESLKTWTLLLIVLGLTSLAVTVLLATTVPLTTLM